MADTGPVVFDSLMFKVKRPCLNPSAPVQGVEFQMILGTPEPFESEDPKFENRLPQINHSDELRQIDVSTERCPLVGEAPSLRA